MQNTATNPTVTAMGNMELILMLLQKITKIARFSKAPTATVDADSYQALGSKRKTSPIIVAVVITKNNDA
jgi:hypothetical protein